MRGKPQYSAKQLGIRKASRTARDQARDDIDDIFLNVRLTGTSIISNHSREAIHGPGTIMLLDARRPGETWDQTPTTSIFACVPRAGLEARLGNLDGLTALPLAPEQPVVGLAVSFMSMLAERAGSFDETIGFKLAEQALDLVALAFSTETGRTGAALSSARATALFRLKSVIEARLCEPGSSPPRSQRRRVSACAMPTRSWRRRATRVERYILHRRLERCRRALEDRRQASRMVGRDRVRLGLLGSVAFRAAFPRRLRLAPGDYRRLRAGDGAMRTPRSQARRQHGKVISRAAEKVADPCAGRNRAGQRRAPVKGGHLGRDFIEEPGARLHRRGHRRRRPCTRSSTTFSTRPASFRACRGRCSHRP